MKLAHDKKLHFIAGMTVCFSVFLVLSNAIYGLLAGAAIGALKEVYDYMNQDTNTPDFMDFVWTAMGSIAAYGIIELLLLT